jgi:hypothetical protein
MMSFIEAVKAILLKPLQLALILPQREIPNGSRWIRPDQVERQVHLAVVVLQEHQERQAQAEQPVRQDLAEVLVPVVRLARQAQAEQPVLADHPVVLALVEHQEPLVLPEQQELAVHLVHPVHQEHREPQVVLVHLGPPAQAVRQERHLLGKALGLQQQLTLSTMLSMRMVIAM